MLVPFTGAEHDWAAVELVAWIAAAGGSSLVLAGPGPDEVSGTRDASRLLAHASLAVQRGLGVAAEPLLVPPWPYRGTLDGKRAPWPTGPELHFDWMDMDSD